MIAIAAAIVLSLLVGVLVYVFLMRKMTGEMVLAAVLTTVALGILLRGLMVLIWSAQQQYPAQALGVAKSVARAARRRAHLAVVAPCWSLTTVVVYGGAVRVPALRPLGRAHARRRAEPAAGGAARHQPARASMRWPGACRR